MSREPNPIKQSSTLDLDEISPVHVQLTEILNPMMNPNPKNDKNYANQCERQQDAQKISISMLYKLLIFALLALLFSRCALIMVSEESTLDSSTLWHISLVGAPFFVTIYQLFICDRSASLVYYIFKLCICFGLAWNAPSAYSTNIANLPSFMIFLCVSRLNSSLRAILSALFDFSKAGRYLFMATFHILPVFVWGSGLASKGYNSLYILFQAGVGIDQVAWILLETTDIWLLLKRLRFLKKGDVIEETHEKWATYQKIVGMYLAFFVMVLLGTGIVCIYPVRSGEAFPAALFAVPFDTSMIVSGMLSFVLIISMCSNYHFNVYGDFPRAHTLPKANIKPQISKWALFNFKLIIWMHMWLSLTIIAFLGSLSSTSVKIYNDKLATTINAQLPWNTTIDLNSLQVLSSINQLAATNDLEYLGRISTFLKYNDNTYDIGSSRLSDATFSSLSVTISSAGVILLICSCLEYLCKQKPANARFNRKRAFFVCFQVAIGVILIIISTTATQFDSSTLMMVLSSGVVLNLLVNMLCSEHV